jgi:integrase
MARTEPDAQGNIRIAFKLNGERVRVQPEGGPFKDTAWNRDHNSIPDILERLAALESMHSLGGDHAVTARREILHLFPSSKALRNAPAMRADESAATKVTDLLQLVEDDYRDQRKRNQKKMLSALVRPRAYFKGMLAADCTAATLLRYRDDRAKEVSAHTGRPLAHATINRELVFLHSGFKLGVPRGLVKAVPEVELYSEKGNARQGFFEHDEFLAVLKYLSPALQPVVKTLYVTGWRRSEVLGLTRHNLDLKANRLRLEVGTTKNLAGREFVLTAELRAVLVGQLERIAAIEARTGWTIEALWVYDDGARVRDFKNVWTQAVKRAWEAGELRTQKKLVHDFRRTVVRNLARANVPQEWAMRVTGHKTAEVYRRYSITDGQTAEMTSQRYEQFLKNQGMGLNGGGQPIYCPNSVVVPEKPRKIRHLEAQSSDSTSDQGA